MRPFGVIKHGWLGNAPHKRGGVGWLHCSCKIIELVMGDFPNMFDYQRLFSKVIKKKGILSATRFFKSWQWVMGFWKNCNNMGLSEIMIFAYFCPIYLAISMGN